MPPVTMDTMMGAVSEHMHEKAEPLSGLETPGVNMWVVLGVVVASFIVMLVCLVVKLAPAGCFTGNPWLCRDAEEGRGAGYLPANLARLGEDLVVVEQDKVKEGGAAGKKAEQKEKRLPEDRTTLIGNAQDMALKEV